MSEPVKRWSVLWRADGGIDGTVRRIIWDAGTPLLFQTRRDARDYIRRHYSYIAKRRDLRKWPHGWRMPVPVRVGIRIEPLGEF